jgi:hypothetical protein
MGADFHLGLILKLVTSSTKSLREPSWYNKGGYTKMMRGLTYLKKTNR